MKKTALLITLLFILSACQPRFTPVPAEILPTRSRTPSPTGTPTPNATERYQGTLQANQTQNAGYLATQSALVTQSAIDKAAAQTAQPTLTPPIIQTPTPLSPQAFDPSTISTATPAIPAVCPQENPDITPVFPTSDAFDYDPSPELEKAVLNYLNLGGPPEKIGQYDQDLTNDGLPELVISSWYFRILTCKDGQFVVVADVKNLFSGIPVPIIIKDLNLDGLPEIVLRRNNPVPVDLVTQYQILEWNGQQFENLVYPYYYENHKNTFVLGHLIEDGWIEIVGVGTGEQDWLVMDVDGNGTMELLLEGGISVNLEISTSGPFRAAKTVYMWNGKNFVWFDAEYEAPHYRYQAIQDADFASYKGQFDKARQLYQQAISSDTLDWWSEARQTYEINQKLATYTGEPTPTAPAPDLDERKYLTAYALYRLILLDILQENIAEAQSTYTFLQEEFPVDQVGYAYAEMATAFWKAYETSQNIATACNKAIEFAREHQEDILYYLGGYYHGYQTFNYKPEDICPFK